MTNDIYGILSEEELLNEVWKPVVNYEGLYEISSVGRIKSLARTWTSGKNGVTRRIKQETFCSIFLNHNGYWGVALCKDGKQEKAQVHRLLAMAFIVNVENKPFVNHKDGVKTNCRLDNLEWSDPKHNTDHAWENGLMEKARKSRTGTNNNFAKLSDLEVEEIRIMYNSGNVTQKELADIYGCSRSNICFIVNYKTRKSQTPVLKKH